MSKATQKQLDKLAEYTKEEIIAALGRSFDGEYTVRVLLRDLEAMTMKREHEALEKATAAEAKALQALIDWRSDMVKQYGNGETVPLAKLPRHEIERGAALEKAYTDATLAVNRAVSKMAKREMK